MPQKINIEFSTPDAYIVHQPQPIRDILEALRNLIKPVVPEAEEMISYQVICFKYHYLLVGIGANKDYCSFHVMSPGLVKQMQDELKDVKVSGSTLHFLPGQPLPEALIRKIVIARVNENLVRDMAKKK